MGEILSLLLIAVTVAFVAAPFFASTADAPATPARVGIDRQRLERQKLDAYTAIKEAEFDYRMGKLSDTDFGKMRDKYAAQALEAIGALESAHVAAPRQLAEARRPTRIAFCPACGHAVPPRARYCPACGRSLAEAVA
jgi:rubrerythrin